MAERIAQCVWGLEGANLNTTFNYSIATTFCNQHLTHNSKLKRCLYPVGKTKKQRKGKEKKRKPRHKKHFVKPFLFGHSNFTVQWILPFFGQRHRLN